MRTMTLALLALTSLAAVPAHAIQISTLNFSLDSYTRDGMPADLAPSQDPPCLQPGCVLFTGTLTYDGVDPVSEFPMFLTDIQVSLPSFLTLDNTFFFAVPGLMSGDPNYAEDGFGPNVYTGPIFGIDIAPGTSVGAYSGTVTIFGFGGLNDPGFEGFSVSHEITVNVIAPEPSAIGLMLAGLVPLAAMWGIRRKWRFSEPSR